MTIALESATPDAVRDAMHLYGLSQAVTAREIGISDSALSQWLAGKYKGDNAAVDLSATAWLEAKRRRQAVQAILPRTAGWVGTPTAKRVLAACEFAQAAGSIAVVYGIAGAGKTATLKHFASKAPNVWRVTGTPATRSVTATLAELAEVVGIKGAASQSAKLYRALVGRLADTHGVIVADEAQHLSLEALEALRSLHDATGVGLVLAGNETVYARLTGGTKAATFAQLFSRIGKQLRIANVKDDDVTALLDAWGVSGPSERAFGLDIGRRPGALRELAQTIRYASVLATSEGSKVTTSHLRAAWTTRSEA